MAASSISCCQLKAPTPAKELAAATTRHQPKSQTAHLPHQLRRACVAAAACAVIGATGVMGGGDGVVMAREMTTMAGASSYDVAHVQAPARWSDRRQCPPWRANSLENIVPENLPRPSVRRRFNSITAAERALASPDAVIPFLALHSGMGCFSL